jgi:hypothetical protein
MRNVSWKAKAVYFIFALALVMGLVPALAAVTPASADDGDKLIPEEEFNIMGAQETFCVPEIYRGTVQLWRFMPSLGLDGGWSVVDGGNVDGPPQADCVTVQGVNVGELVIVADTNLDLDMDGTLDSLYGVKKWGKINDTIISGPGSTEVVWCEDMKEFVGKATIYEMVIGTFEGDPEEFEFEMPANGADVEWWLLNADAPVHDLPMYGAATDLVDAINLMHDEWAAKHVVFCDSGTTMTATTSGDTDIDMDMIPDDGATSVSLCAKGEEAVKVICLAKYPYGIDGPQWPVFIEMTSWNFWTQQLEKVPQVRWAGEKIVLEKQFGMSYAGDPVIFYLENQSVGTLEGIGWGGMMPGIPGVVPTQDTVVSIVDPMGVARAILTSESPGECDVTAALYEWVCAANFVVGIDTTPPPECYYKLINQHGFVVFFLKLEDITLGNVLGERVDNPLTGGGTHWEWNPFTGEWQWVEGHDSGIWSPENPWGTSTDMMAETLNVSEDTLLRARVKGWFMGDDLSTREAKAVDLDPTWDSDGDGVTNNDGDMMLPAGRWVLPDDWPRLAGPRWEEFRPHWDLMDNPYDMIMSVPDTDADKLEELGPYMDYSPILVGEAPELVALAPVIGPYNSLDNYGPYIEVPKLGWKTILDNGMLEWWDCPMPPAKIIFEIDAGPGFLKEVNKGHVYYHLMDLDANPPSPDSILYTNPYYYEVIPAHILIPPFVNNGGYDWNSWDDSYGPYPFWAIFNRPNPDDDPQHPTKVEVYSDNHGEAMVYLNGDWNLDLSAWQVPKPPPHDAYDVPLGEVVGTSDVVAIADYPYMRKHPVMVSDVVTKNWTWGKEIVVHVEQMTDAAGEPVIDEKMVTVWVTDRDGFPAVDEEIKWMTGGLEGIIEGFLPDTGGMHLNPEQTVAVSWTRLPTPEEVEKFETCIKPGMECHHAVAGVVVHCSLPIPVDLHMEFMEREGVIIRDVVLNFAMYDPVDPLIHLDAGLNLIGWVAPDVPVANGVATLGDALATVWSLDGDEWLVYAPSAPSYVIDNFSLEYAKGYFFYMYEAVDWNLGSF